MECKTEEEIERHEKEVIAFFEKIQELNDYNCAVLCKYQDIGHRHKKMRIEGINLHDLDTVLERADIKNGIDIFADEKEEYIVIIAYGQSYTMQGENHFVVEAYKVLPYDDNKMFINIVDSILNRGEDHIAVNQFES